MRKQTLFKNYFSCQNIGWSGNLKSTLDDHDFFDEADFECFEMLANSELYNRNEQDDFLMITDK